MPNADVFISYPRSQRTEVARIAERLAELGLSVWFDARLEAGSNFDEEINREVRTAKTVLVCWSPAAVQSRWVRAEASIGLERDVLVAAFLEHTELMPPYTLIHTANLIGWDGNSQSEGWQETLARIGNLTGREELGRSAIAQALATDWGERDATARARYLADVAETRRRFVETHSRAPADFEDRLAALQINFESWLTRRRGGFQEAPPRPQALIETEADLLRLDIAALERERNAAFAIAEREREGAQQSVLAASVRARQLEEEARVGGARAAGPYSYQDVAFRTISVLLLGGFALSAWAMRREAAIYFFTWVLLVIATIGVVSQEAFSMSTYPDKGVAYCFDVQAQVWKNQGGNRYDGVDIPTGWEDTDTCLYKNGFQKGKEEGERETYLWAQRRAAELVASSFLGWFLILNIIFSVYTAIKGSIRAIRAKKLGFSTANNEI